MSPHDIMIPLFGLGIGAGITLFVSRHYYKKAGDELKREATKLMQEAVELERLNKLILHGLENAGILELVKDASGRSTGIVIKIGGTIAGEGWLSARGEVTPRRSPEHKATQADDVDTSHSQS